MQIQKLHAIYVSTAAVCMCIVIVCGVCMRACVWSVCVYTGMIVF